jgi:hypothetical protein
MSRTIEAWMTVENMENGVPFYKLAVDPADRPEVMHIEAGNFFLPFSGGRILPAIIDPEAVFGHITDFSSPFNFLRRERFSLPGKQASRNKIPSAFCSLCSGLEKGEEIVFHSIYGNMRNRNKLNSELKRLVSEDYITQKKTRKSGIDRRPYARHTHRKCLKMFRPLCRADLPRQHYARRLPAGIPRRQR